MSILIKNATIVTQDAQRRVLKNANIYVENNIISEIGKGKQEAEKVVDASKKVAIPGLINTHTHLPMSLLRGLSDELPLDRWLGEKIWPFEKKMTKEDMKLGTLLSCLENTRFGNTTCLDMYFNPQQVSEAVEQSGLRAVIAAAIIDFDENSMKNAKKFLKNKPGKTIPAVGPHSAYTCSKETLLESKELAEKHDTLLHTHASETRKENLQVYEKTGKRPIGFLEQLGLLGEKTVLAHCCWLSNSEAKKLGERKTSVAHCPTSNQKLATGGVCPVPELLKAGANVALATDGQASNNNLDMFEEMKNACLLQKSFKWDPTVLTAQQSLDMATREAAKALHLFDRVGSIEEGKLADLVLVDFSSPHLVPVHDYVSNIVYSAKGSDVDTVICDGKILLENKKIVSPNAEKILREAEKRVAELKR